MKAPEGVKCQRCRKYFFPGSMGDGGDGLCCDCANPKQRSGAENDHDPDCKRDAKRNGDL